MIDVSSLQHEIERMEREKKARETQEETRRRTEYEKERALLLDLTRHPGWAIFVRRLEQSLDAELQGTRSAKESHTSAQHAGAVYALRQIIKMPEAIAAASE